MAGERGGGGRRASRACPTHVYTRRDERLADSSAAVYPSLFGNDGPFPWVNCTVANRKFRPCRIFVGDYSPRASKIRDDETKHRPAYGSDVWLSSESSHARFQNSDQTPHLVTNLFSRPYAPIRSQLNNSLTAPTHRSFFFFLSFHPFLTFSFFFFTRPPPSTDNVLSTATSRETERERERDREKKNEDGRKDLTVLMQFSTADGLLL